MAAQDVFDDGGTWYANVSVLNRHTGKWTRSRPSTRVKVDNSSPKAHEASRQRALKVRQTLLAAATLAAAKSPADGRPEKTLAQAFAARAEVMRVRGAPKSSVQRTEDARRWLFEHFGKGALVSGPGGPGGLKKADLRRYADWRMRAGKAPGTIRRELVELCASCRAVDVEPPELPDLPGAVYRETFALKEDVLRICDELPPHRARAVMLAFQTGLRAGEVFRIRWLEPGYGGMPGPRGGLKTGPRVVPLSPVADQILRAGPIAPWGKRNRLRDLQAACRRAGVTVVNWNDLRAGTATALLRAGLAPAKIASLLGHKSLRMIERRYATLRNAGTLPSDVAVLSEGVD